MARVLVGFLAAAIALALGIQAAVAVFFAPVLIYGDDKILLAWGWIAPFAALPIAFGVGWLAKGMVTRLMTAGGSMVSWRRIAAVAAIGTAVASGISYFMMTLGDQDIRWSEEVVFHDGTAVVVSRRVVGNSFGRPKVQPEAWLPVAFELELPPAVQAQSRVVGWRSSLRPVLLDKGAASAKWVLLAEPKDCGEWYTMGRPAPPYRAYELRDGNWSQVDPPRELIGRSANLLVSPRFTGEDPLVSAAVAADRNTAGHPRDSWPVIKERSKC